MAEPLFLKVVNDYRTALDDMYVAQVKDMAKMWRSTAQGMFDQMELLANELAEQKRTGQRYDQDRLFQMERYQRLLVQINEQLGRLREETIPLIDEQQRVWAAHGDAFAEDMMRTMRDRTPAGANEVRLGFDYLQSEPIENLVALARAGQPLERLLRSATGDTVQAVTNVLVANTAAGINPRETARDMMAKGFGAGLNRALTIARDQQIRAYREGGRQHYIELGVKSYKRLAAKNSRTCFIEKTKILTSDGEIDIEKIEPGQLVYTGKGRLRPVRATLSAKYDDELIELRVSNGSVLTCTKEHPILVERQGQLNWVAARSVVVGDRVISKEGVSQDRKHLLRGIAIKRRVWQAHDQVASGGETESLASVMVRPISVPVNAVNFEGNIQGRQIEVNQESVNGRFLNEGYVHETETLADGGLGFGFATVPPGAGVGAKSPTRGGLYPKVLSTRQTSDDIWRSSARLGAVSSVLRSLKYFAASLTNLSSQLNLDLITGGASFETVGPGRSFFNFGSAVNAIKCDPGTLFKFVAPLAAKKSWLTDVSLKFVSAPLASVRSSFSLVKPHTSSAATKVSVVIFDVGSPSLEGFTALRTDQFYETGHEKQTPQISYNLDIITSVTRLVKSDVQVYNLEVEEDQTYFANGILVHNCVLAGTMIRVERGRQRPIEEIEVGDMAWTRGGFKPVMGTMISHFDGHVVELSAGSRSVIVTADHPVWVEERGWIEAERIRYGDRLKVVDCAEPVQMIRMHRERTVVYNLSVADCPEYFANDILVHNCAACLALDGTEYPTNQLMPLHPVDRCSMIPVVPGLTPTWETGEAWFARQDERTQIKVLGRGKWEAWKDGVFEFRQLAAPTQHPIWGPGMRVPSLKELRNGGPMGQQPLFSPPEPSAPATPPPKPTAVALDQVERQMGIATALDQVKGLSGQARSYYGIPKTALETTEAFERWVKAEIAAGNKAVGQMGRKIGTDLEGLVKAAPPPAVVVETRMNLETALDRVKGLSGQARSYYGIPKSALETPEAFEEWLRKEQAAGNKAVAQMSKKIDLDLTKVISQSGVTVTAPAVGTPKVVSAPRFQGEVSRLEQAHQKLLAMPVSTRKALRLPDEVFESPEKLFDWTAQRLRRVGRGNYELQQASQYAGTDLTKLVTQVRKVRTSEEDEAVQQRVNKLADHADELKALKRQENEIIAGMVDDEKVTVQDMNKATRTIRDRQDALNRTVISEYNALLNEISPADVSLKGHMSTAERSVEDWLITHLHNRDDLQKADVEVKRIDGGRAYYAPGTAIMYVGKIGETPKSIAHEFGHYLEEKSPIIGKMAKEFLDSRTRGQEEVDISTLPGCEGYLSEVEFTIPDEFFSPYVGKQYRGATEIFSMGLEAMYRDTAGFLRKDPEHFALTLAMMIGVKL